MSEVLLMDILNVYAREQGKGEVRDYRIRNTYNPAMISVEISYVDKEYLESLVEQLKVGVRLDSKDSSYVARLLASHPVLDSFVNEKPSPFAEPSDAALDVGPLGDPPIEGIEEIRSFGAKNTFTLDLERDPMLASLGDCQSPAADKLRIPIPEGEELL